MVDNAVTPGVGRVVEFQINGHTFGFRRPSRADLSNVWRLWVSKLVATGAPTEGDMLNIYVGGEFMWEARLEVGLRPYRLRDGKDIKLGETAPAHWLDDGYISFARVDPAEFEAVVAYLETLDLFPVKKKTEPQMPTSGESAPDQTSG